MSMHYAENVDELKKMLAADAHSSPCLFLRDDSFAAHCYDRMSLRELKNAFQRDADPDECQKWALSALQWKEQIAMALLAKAAVRIP